MLLTSVVLILQETLEAALLLSILAVITLRVGARPRAWMPWGLVAGAILAFVYAVNLRHVSEWFDYVGQELTNAALQFGIALAIIATAAWLGRFSSRPDASPVTARGRRGLVLLCVVTIALAITREGSEILVFLGGFLGQQEALHAVLAGSGIGFGIGVSIGFLLFYGLLAAGNSSAPLARVVPLALLALFCGNMLSQSALQLVQADWLPSLAPLWDSSGWLSEQSVAGRLLYSLVGYESRPSPVQVVAYSAGLVAVPGVFLAMRRGSA